MNSIENFYRMMEGRHPERMPIDMPFTQPALDMVRKNLGDPYEVFDLDFCGNWHHLKDDAAKWRVALEKLGFPFPPNSHVGGFGMAYVTPPIETLGAATHLTEKIHPLSIVEDVSQLEGLPWPDVTDTSGFKDFVAHAKSTHERGKVAVGCLECTIFESTWYLRGMENVYCDWMEDNGISDWLLDYFTNRSVHAVKSFVAAGYDVIRLGDDVGTQISLMMSAEMWRKHLKPRLKKVIDTIRESSDRKVWVQYHSDGNITDLIDELIEIGVDILNPMQPECIDVATVVPKFQNRLAFCGMVGTQTTMPFGTPGDVKKVVEQIADLHRKGARLIIAPTHVIEPDVPLENIRALAESVRAARF